MINFKKIHLMGLVALIVSSASHASLFFEREQVDHWLSVLSSDSETVEEKDIEYGILPGPFYTPELGVGLGLAAVATYRLDKEDSTSQDSSFALSGYVSSSGAFGFGFDNYNFFAHDQWRFFLSGSMQNNPTDYWGVGQKAGDNSANKEEYTHESFELTPSLFYQIYPQTYLGITWDLGFYKARELERNSKFLGYDEGRTITASGAGLNFIYDTRDFIPNPTQGMVFDASALYYSSDLGSDQRFQRYHIMYGQYIALDNSANNLIAYEANLHLSNGNVPWSKMAMLGGSHQMRGYYEGRYRDRNMFTTQIELRQNLDWRHGMVYWLGVGTLSHKTDDLGSKKWLPNVGVGYRFEFQPRMNVRLDLGIGRDTIGFYFQVGEAF